MKLQARNFVVRKPETIDITMFFKKFCIATRTKQKHRSVSRYGVFVWSCGEEGLNRAAHRSAQSTPQCGVD